MLEIKGDTIIYHGRQVGTIKDKAFRTYRGPQHFYRKFQSFGISKEVLIYLRSLDIEEIIFAYDGVKSKWYKCSVTTYLQKGEIVIDKSEDYGEDIQLHIPIKDMEDVQPIKSQEVKNKMMNLKEKAIGYKPANLLKNISELPEVSTALAVMEDVIGEENREYSYIEFNDDRYEVKKSVLQQLQVILAEKPNLEKFKVIKQGEGMQTKYTVIPL